MNIKAKIDSLTKEENKIKSVGLAKNLGYGLLEAFFIIPGALSILVTPLLTLSYLTIGAGIINSHRKFVKEKNAKIAAIESEKKNLMKLRKNGISISKKSQDARTAKITTLTQEETNHKKSINESEKSRKRANVAFVGSTVLGLVCPIPFAIAASIALAYKWSKDSKLIESKKRIATIEKEKEYTKLESDIADEIRQKKAKQQAGQQSAKPTQQTKKKPLAATAPSKTRNEEAIDEYIEMMIKKPQELDNNKVLIKK